MAVIHTESFGWSTTMSDYTSYKGYTTATGQILTPGAYAGSSYLSYVAFGAQGDVRQPVPGAARYFVGGRGGKALDNLESLAIQALDSGLVDTWQVAAQSGTGLLRVDINGTVLATGTHNVMDGGWHFIEVDFNTAGTIIVHVDGAADISVASTLSGTITLVRWLCNGASWQDLYIADTTAPNNGFLGDVHVECRRPNGAGASTIWTPNGAASNWQCVDDSPHPDGDTTFVATAGVGNRDSYALPSIAEATPTAVPAVACYIIADKDNTAPRGVKASIHSGSADLDGTELALTNGTYAGARVIAQVDPSTSAAWTAAGANAAKAGILLSS